MIIPSLMYRQFSICPLVDLRLGSQMSRLKTIDEGCLFEHCTEYFAKLLFYKKIHKNISHIFSWASLLRECVCVLFVFIELVLVFPSDKSNRLFLVLWLLHSFLVNDMRRGSFTHKWNVGQITVLLSLCYWTLSIY